MGENLLEIKNLRATVEGKEILKGINLKVNKGEIHVIMGPNGAGKSTLANVIMGDPTYEITGGEITFQGESINELEVDKRARKGIFLSFQYPEEIPGISVENFLRTAKAAVTGEEQGIFQFRKLLLEKMAMLDMKEEYAGRYLNHGFSGGEKKKNEILQMAMLEPVLAILDETDSGLDIDAIRIVTEGIRKIASEENSFLIITHYNRILDYLDADYVHILMYGRIVKSGDISLAKEIEESGFIALEEVRNG
ncbi:MAG: Fe-S cluster assembly ATPase SufC [Halanaerobiaceae bacterium]|nr:Fe-S cluster assembly ATPase SufC [Halanaerobiaceae bacterium]